MTDGRARGSQISSLTHGARRLSPCIDAIANASNRIPPKTFQKCDMPGTREVSGQAVNPGDPWPRVLAGSLQEL